MAFPNDVKEFVQAIDPSTVTDAQNIAQYQSLISEGKFTQAQTLLASMQQGIEMNINAGRYNDVIDTIEAIEKFYIGLNGIKQYIQNNVDAFADIKLYNNTTNYVVGNIASNGTQWFINIQDCVGIEPEVTAGWENYWQYFLQQQHAKQYPIQSEQPTGQSIGDLWFEEL